MAFVRGKAQAHKRLGGGAGAAVLLALLAPVAAASAERYRSTREPCASWWMVRWPVGEEAVVVVLWLSQWNGDGPRATSR